MNSQTNNNSEPNDFAEFFELNFLNKFLEKTYNYAQKHFERFSAIFVAVTTICGFLIRVYGYTYQSAKLSKYNIDKSYISLNDNFLLQIIEYICLGIIYIIFNYVFFYICTKKDSSKFHWKRSCQVLAFLVIEAFLITALSTLKEGYRAVDLITGFIHSNISTRITFVIILALVPLSLNIIGVQILISRHKTGRNASLNATANTINVTASNKYISSIIFAAVFVSIPLAASYLSGLFMENQRTSFKIIPEQITQEQTYDTATDNNIFTFKDNKQYYLYAVVFENEEVYILCQLNKSDGSVLLDTDYQKIVSKDNLVTYNISNIYKISYIN